MIKQQTSKVKFKIGTVKVKKMILGTQKVWSGASVVSYYDGNTLLGTEEVDEGLDVLHPSIDTSKTGYTLVGWSTTNDESGYVTSLMATGEPMNVYAVYVPNTLTAVQGSISDNHYNLSIQNTKYATGSMGSSDGRATGSVSPGNIGAGFNITVNLGFYSKAVMTYKLQSRVSWGGGLQNYYCKYDGSNVSEDSHTVTLTASGTHNGGIGGYVFDASIGVCGGVLSLVMQEPNAWV